MTSHSATLSALTRRLPFGA